MANKDASASPRLVDLTKEYATEALEVLAQIAERGESGSARLTASIALLDRAYGRPFAISDASEEEFDMDKVLHPQTPELLARMAKLKCFKNSSGIASQGSVATSAKPIAAPPKEP